jgi:hypothetical protein
MNESYNYRLFNNDCWANTHNVIYPALLPASALMVCFTASALVVGW